MISSAANPLVKRVRRLASDRRARRRDGAFVVEGIAPVWRAVEAGARVETLLAAPQLIHGSAAARLIAAAAAAGADVVEVSAGLFHRLSGREGPAGVLAIVAGRVGGLGDLATGPGTLAVGLYAVANPGNLGTVIRTADAAGAGPVITIGPSSDPFDPVAVKASMGALFDVPLGHADTVEAFFGWAAERGLEVYTTSSHARTPLWDAPWRPPLALLLGSEREGLPDPVIDRGAWQLQIPTVGRTSSLNLAASAAILLFEGRRRIGPPPPAGTMA